MISPLWSIGVGIDLELKIQVDMMIEWYCIWTIFGLWFDQRWHWGWSTTTQKTWKPWKFLNRLHLLITQILQGYAWFIRPWFILWLTVILWACQDNCWMAKFTGCNCSLRSLSHYRKRKIDNEVASLPNTI